MKLYGYIEPPFTIIDFVPIVYKYNNDFYSAIIQNHQIKEFYKISPYAQVRAITNINIKKQVNDAAYYCYLAPDYEEIYGEHESINFRLFELLVSDKLNDFAKLSIAYFTKLLGLQKRLINDINNKFRSSNPDFVLLETKPDFTEINIRTKDKIILKYITDWESIIKRFKITWKDIIYTDGINIYFDTYFASLNAFLTIIPYSKNILKKYIILLGHKERRLLEISNKQLYEMSFDYCLPFPLSLEEENNLTEALTATYDIERSYTYRKIDPSLFKQYKVQLEEQAPKMTYSKRELKANKVKYAQLELLP